MYVNCTRFTQHLTQCVDKIFVICNMFAENMSSGYCYELCWNILDL